MTWSIRLGPIYSRQNKSTATVGWLYIVLVILANISENMCLLRHSKTTTYMFITVYSIVKRKGFCLFRGWEIQIRPDIIHCSGFSSVIVHTVISYKSFELLISNVKCSPHYKWWRKRNSPTENENSLIYSHPRVVKNLYDFISSMEHDRSYSEELNRFGFHWLLCFYRRKQVIQVWNNMRMSFGVDCVF